jgi:hypothetical protein
MDDLLNKAVATRACSGRILVMTASCADTNTKSMSWAGLGASTMHRIIETSMEYSYRRNAGSMDTTIKNKKSRHLC